MVILLFYVVLIVMAILIKNKRNIIVLFLIFECSYIVGLVIIAGCCLFEGPSSIHYGVIFLFYIALATLKSLIGICLLMNYIRLYNTIYL